MALVDIIRKVVPSKQRRIIGRWAVSQASRTSFTLQLYLRILHKGALEDLRIKKGQCVLNYMGREIVAPRNSAGIFLEVFQNEVYEKFWSPQKGDIVLDVGAYVGMFTIKAAKMVGPNGLVVAIEPEPYWYSLLEENTRGLGNVVLIKKAICDKEGYAKLFHSKTPGGDALIQAWKDYVEVETTTLDKLVERLKLPKVDFIKMDAEGVELAVLRGAKNILKGDVKLAMSSYHTFTEGGSEHPGVVNLLSGIGFKVITKRGLAGYIYATRNTNWGKLKQKKEAQK